MQKEKVRVYALARELNMESKDLLDMCRAHGIDVKNQLSSLDPEQRDAIELMVRSRGGVAVAPPPPKPVTPSVINRAVPTLQGKPVPNLAAKPPLRREAEPPYAEPVPSEAPARVEAPPPPVVTPPPTPVPPPPPVKEPPPVIQAPAARVAPPPPIAGMVPPPVSTPPQAPPMVAPVVPPAAVTPPPPPVVQAPAAQAPPPPNVPMKPAAIGPSKMRDLDQPGRPEGGGQPRRRDRVIPRPSTIRVAPPPQPKARAVEPPKVQQPVAQKKFMDLPADVKSGERAVTNVADLMKPVAKVVAPVVGDADIIEDDAEGDKDKARKGPGGVAGRGDRHKARQERSKLRKGRENEATSGRALLLDDVDERHRRGKKSLKEKLKLRGTQPRKGKVPITLPITVRALGEAIGINKGELLFKLRDHGLPTTTTINSTLDADTAVLIALENGCELEIKKPLDAEEQMLAGLEKPDNPEDLVLRAPIVTIMGHVDHGKTSLLDKIRQSNIVATEAGGITQVIRAWRVDHGGRPITFLDTPGHEAFTKMRARGANVTDVAVIVVAADDGVMPQTEEAINHAKAAGVSIVVAINKVDLPNANIRKTEQQLYGLGLIPDNMGGDVPFVQTSAAKGTGIDLLLDTLSVVAEVKELKANPAKPAHGTVLEAMLSEGEGVLATLLVRDGTLRKGDVILCGATYGRVRALYDDLGRHIEEAGPSVPVRITGLDFVPNADDPFQVVPELSVARDIADKRKEKALEASQIRRAPLDLATLNVAKIAELKVILKADFRGSIEAIKKELEKLYHDEVRVRVLHTGIGGITESDVQLALASPDDTIIVGFNVVPDDRAKSLAEERGVQVNEYDIIYKLTDDIRSALEGKLKPREEVIHLGRAVVRETFKISRVGTIAGCYVTQGTIERSAKVRVIRDGIVVYPPTDRTVGLESLKRFKEDSRDVREGFECGIKIAGYDDIKVGDVIEAYRIEQVQRTL